MEDLSLATTSADTVPSDANDPAGIGCALEDAPEALRALYTRSIESGSTTDIVPEPYWTARPTDPDEEGDGFFAHVFNKFEVAKNTTFLSREPNILLIPRTTLFIGAAECVSMFRRSAY